MVTSVACVILHCWLLFELCRLAVAWTWNAKTVLWEELRIEQDEPACSWIWMIYSHHQEEKGQPVLPGCRFSGSTSGSS